MFDLDGTLLLSDRALGGYEILPGAIEVLTALRERAFPFVLLTNGSNYVTWVSSVMTRSSRRSWLAGEGRRRSRSRPG